MEKSKRRRIFLLDEIRGFCIILMVIYHAAATLEIFFDVKIPFYHSLLIDILQIFFACVFIVISGISCRLSRNNLRRGLLCFGAGLLVTAATYIASPRDAVTFGILHFLGVCMVLFSLTQKDLDKIGEKKGMAVCALLFAAFYGFEGRTILFGLVKLPDFLYRTDLLSPLGLISESYSALDFFPLIPYLFVFFFGAYLGKILAGEGCPKGFYKMRCRPLAFIGRNTLWIYLAHQPVLMLIFTYMFHSS